MLGRMPRPSGLLWFVGLSLAAVLGCKAEPTETPPIATPEPTSDAEPSACGLQADGSRRFRILHINDVYRIEGLADGRGGLGRLRTLRLELESDCPGDVLLTHAGDTLAPSLLSRTYKGAQMIEVLNALDGDPAAFDPRMLLTFGNHEFDDGKLEDATTLDTRVEDSQFAWLATSVTWANGADGQPLVAAPNLHTQELLEIGGVKVGLFSLMTDAAVPAYVTRIDTNYVELARTQVAALRGAGAEVVIALTHLDAGVDQQLLDALPGGDGPDVILGGHDHVLMTLHGNGKSAYKGDADALRVRVIDVTLGADGRVAIASPDEGVALGPDQPSADPQVQALIDARLAAFNQTFCGAEPPDCLSKELTVTNTKLLAEELEIRRYESNYGDWIADRMLDIFAADDVELALINSGSLRLNQDISAGTPITRQIVEETFAYPAKVSLISIDGATLQKVLDHAVEGWTGSGHWLQIAGLAYRHDVTANTATGAVTLGPDGPQPLARKRKYKVAVPNFLLDTTGSQDGYTMLSPKMVVATPRNGTDLKQVVLDALAAAGSAGISPQVEGRICSSDRPSGPCLVP
jgi:2',3'-cyclic-nucleotide 2'-phosphodiesterase (5'-nucleotidase family)